jgi:hypothetical protein
MRDAMVDDWSGKVCVMKNRCGVSERRGRVTSCFRGHPTGNTLAAGRR